jgi:hypothetical protein
LYLEEAIDPILVASAVDSKALISFQFLANVQESGADDNDSNIQFLVNVPNDPSTVGLFDLAQHSRDGL